MGTLRERTTKNGDPYLVCSTGKTGCGMSPIWDTSLEDYLAVRGDEDFNNAALDPAEFGEPFPFGDRSPTPIETVLQEGNVTVQSESFATNGMPVPTASSIPALTGVPANCHEIRRLIEGMAPETIRDVFTSVPGGAAIISPRPTGGWKLGLGKLADAGEAVQIELIAALAKANG
jgi:hypothetical protein